MPSFTRTPQTSSTSIWLQFFVELAAALTATVRDQDAPLAEATAPERTSS